MKKSSKTVSDPMSAVCYADILPSHLTATIIIHTKCLPYT